MKIFKFKIYINSYYFMFNFYQVNRDDEIQNYDRLISRF
jgi:hypothetical protein